MRYPDFINPGETIGFPAPSFGCNIEPYISTFAAAKQKFTKLGYATEDGPNSHAGDGVGISSTPQNCAKEFCDMYSSDTTQALISCGGGELMCEILPYLDLDVIKMSKPKWFMGYSDNTNLTFLLTTIFDTAAIYGPCVASFGQGKWHACVQDAFSVLTGDKRLLSEDENGVRVISVHNYDGWESESLKDEDNPFVSYNITEEFNPIVMGDDHAKGRLLGGCLDCLSNLVGTRFDNVRDFNEKYSSDGILWYLEACDLNVFDMRRSLWSLREAGWFDKASGFMFGRPMHFDEPMFGLDRIAALTEPLKGLGVPVFLDLDIGHLPPMMPIINGSYGEIEVKNGAVSLKMSLK